METTTTLARRVSHMTLIVNDQDKALTFYSKALGTEVRGDDTFDFGGQSMRWLTVGIPGDDLEIAITTPMPGPDGRVPTAGDNNMTVIEVADVDAATRQWEAAGGTVSSPPEDVPWGRSAVVRDPDGNPWNLVKPQG